MKRHGQSGKKATPEYAAWHHMKDRCLNPNDIRYYDYGGRGIKVCKRWMDFNNFYLDMGKRPSANHSLDRFPNNNGHYKPSNCRWATPAQQRIGRRNTRWIKYEGEMLTIKEISERTGKDEGWVRRRFVQGIKPVNSKNLDCIMSLFEAGVCNRKDFKSKSGLNYDAVANSLWVLKKKGIIVNESTGVWRLIRKNNAYAANII